MLDKQEVSLRRVNRLYSLIDLTSLNETDDSTVIAALCKKAVRHSYHVAAVCVYPRFVQQVCGLLRGASVKIATVVNFPNGNDELELVVAHIHEALAHGAQEIDLVFPYQRYLAGEKSFASEFIRACKSACGRQVLKVILETGVLQDADVIAEVSELAILAGADFLKTSTGKVAVGATLDAAKVMLLAIKNKAIHPVGLKISGGIRTIDQANEYVLLAEKIMGTGWVTPEHFRIGASQLVDELLR